MAYSHYIALESKLIGCAMLEERGGQTVGKAQEAGITDAHFQHPQHRALWRVICEQAMLGADCSSAGIYAACAGNAAKLEGLGGVSALTQHDVDTTLHAPEYIKHLHELFRKREANRLLKAAAEGIKDGAGDLASISPILEQVAEVVSSVSHTHRQLPEIAADAILDAEEAIRGDKATRTLICTGLPSFDRYATPIEQHEYVVVGARTSHGKSSFLTQLAGTAIAQGHRVAFFTLETEDKAVLKAIVGQRAQVNVKKLAEELPGKQKEFIDKLRFAGSTKNLVIYDRDMTLGQIQSRCRLLASTFKPHLVILDYLGLVGGTGGKSPYERMSLVSKAMIPLRKVLGCALVVGAQLSRSSESERREPTRTDFRDAGGIEEDAHRCLALWRKPGQALDMEYFDTDLLQLKLRDGPLAHVPLRFHGRTTRFMEAAI